MDQNTMVIFTSDNGPEVGTVIEMRGRHQHDGAYPWRGMKRDNWEGGHRVPAIAWWPGRIEPRQETDVLAISLDIMPTLLSIAGCDQQAGLALDGVDLSPVLFDKQSLGDRQLFWNGRAMRDGKWKLVRGKPKQGEVELFDLSQDVGEKVNLADQYPERVAQMRKALDAWEKDVSTGATVQPAQR